MPASRAILAIERSAYACVGEQPRALVEQLPAALVDVEAGVGGLGHAARSLSRY